MRVLLVLSTLLIACDDGPAPPRDADVPFDADVPRDADVPFDADVPRDADADGDAAPCAPGTLRGDDGVCSVEAELRVAAADGVDLATWVVLPVDVPSGGVPTLLSRTPYNESFAGMRDVDREVGRFHAARGYAYVAQDVRGRPRSDGEFRPSTNEVEDGHATVDWIVDQPWSNGAVGTLGGSYLGYTALAAAADHPAVRVVVADDPSIDETTPRLGGTFWTSTITWLLLVERGQTATDQQLADLTNGFDIPGADEALLGHDSAYWNDVAAHDDLGFWPEDSIALMGERFCVPTLIVYSRSTGWRDPVSAFEAIAASGCPEHRGDVRLVLTPEPHVYHLGQLGAEVTPVNQLMLDYIDHHLGGRDVDLSDVPLVQYADEGEPYAGAEVWPAATSELVFALEARSGALVDEPELEATVELELDPSAMDPCAGDYPYLDFVGQPLDADALVVGEIGVELEVTLDVPDADLFADLYELNDAFAGGYRVVQYGAARVRYHAGASPAEVAPGTPVAIEIRMLPVAHRLRAGSRLELTVTNGACGWFENPLSGEPSGVETTPVPGVVSLATGEGHDSRLVLPIR